MSGSFPLLPTPSSAIYSVSKPRALSNKACDQEPAPLQLEGSEPHVVDAALLSMVRSQTRGMISVHPYSVAL